MNDASSTLDAMITGDLLIGGEAVAGRDNAFNAVDPKTAKPIDPPFKGGTTDDVAKACSLAADAFDAYRETTLEQRAAFLEAIATRILGLGDALIDRACTESGLPRPRIEGERGRTVGQLRLFASVIREGSWLGARIDRAQPERKPMPRADIRLRMIPLGPVAVFGASNFPLAFSVAGGDTASALAAGCPVVVKAHPAHPGTSELVGRAIQQAVKDCGLPAGVFALVGGSGNAIGGALVANPHIKAVGFTGSRRGGLALVAIAAARPEPIPVYAEMSSINPLFLLPAALKARGATIGRDFIGSLTMGAGQFCTNPGLVLAVDGPDLEAFMTSASDTIQNAAALTMLTGGIQSAYKSGVEQLEGHNNVKTVARGQAEVGPVEARAGLFVTDLASFLSDERLRDEVFGSSSLVVRCPDVASLRVAAEALEGQLTATLQMDDGDHDVARSLLPVLERKAGRILVNGFPTGVEVCHAMVHGGPYPATSDPRSTSVGSLAIERFLRPVCYQDLAEALLPVSLQNTNALAIPRRIEGVIGKD
ncbi:aldehyde dehydrogenase (NADP(+)) [Lichenihabitans sp. PAMC28606]|uniref:aldehyde dehydrogenase (NADP(+)) n=1 Tax=Lichenihabitans sp. PAMC28606 TaxID=2880932 RepID=UPI001D0A0B64|nr:aldehyde dehydrogenase (NADP(+)) [Lichenihabitans sp. PAMC28606]UDL95831.1 aldehyde dehydrogenase (NADP(+)) [Lichenihabitans sp. PAMC28606]